MEDLEIIRDFTTIIATSTASYVALVGLGAWKQQMRGRIEYELARRYLRSVFKVRDAINTVRNPYISVDEMSVALSESGLDNADIEDNNKTNRAVYSRRWKNVTDASSDLRLEQLEAEVLWGKSAVQIYNEMNGCIKRLYVGVKMFLNGSVHKLSDREIIYDLGDDDVFSKEMDAAVVKIEEYLRPHLK